MDSTPLLRFLLVGKLSRDFLILPDGSTQLDSPGGSLFYAAGGLGLWEQGIGLIGRAGEDYPVEWIERFERRGIDVRGVRILPQPHDLRSFTAYPDLETVIVDNPVAQFSRLGLPFPKALLGYSPPEPNLDSRTRLGDLSLRANDFPSDYLDATAAHICSLDFLSHTLIPTRLRQGNVTTITLDPGEGYMNPIFFSDMPVILGGLTAFLVSERKLRNLFRGRSEDLWEMAEALAAYGCELIVIKRGPSGQLLYDHTNHSRWNIPAYPARILNPHGAGNAYGGGFLAGYRATYEPLQAALYGNVSAAFSMEGRLPDYPLDAMPGLAEARRSALKDMVRRL